VYPSPGGHPYTGAWSYGVAKSTKSPEAAYWLLRYLTSFDTGLRMFKEAGLIPGRTDVMESIAKTEPVYPLGMLAKYHADVWKATAKDVSNYWYFNTKAGGKVYDMQIYALNKALTGEQTIDEVVDNVTKQTLELTSKFDKKIPISAE
jgi:multiple sugar transport system substrate-binding protein